MAPDTFPIPACELCSYNGDRPVNGSSTMEKSTGKAECRAGFRAPNPKVPRAKDLLPSPPREEDNGLEVPADPKKPYQPNLVQDNADQKLSRSQAFTPFHRPSIELVESGP